MSNSRFRLSARIFASVVALLTGLIVGPVSAAEELPEDPLNSVMWTNMAERFFPGKVVIDQRVIVHLSLIHI